ncbi:Tautomerase/MIF [Fomitopsis serialis]|uniref:Tautomerase/MIF n=1 Tax=Fomitopsis serialis TaxID=139415 RepID=UPI002007A75D|nr:Tautomerase/MIF [Neoantrodia serialis]KAH9926123.1 Tautomerase/MIF [Neoantrodia serialis]
MPSLELKTNVPLEDPKPFLLEFSSIAAKTLRKPELYVSVSYHYNENLTFDGSFDPAFLMTVTSLDNLKPGLTDEYSKSFFEFFREKLGIEGDRGYITFLDPGRAFLGHNATTFGTIFGK